MHFGQKLSVAVLALCATLCPGCKQTVTQLNGSEATVYNLQYSNVRAYWLAHELVLVYEQDYSVPPNVVGFGAPVPNQVIRLQINTDRVTLAKNTPIPLLGDEFFPNAFFARYTLSVQSQQLEQDPDMPALSGGNITFTDVSMDQTQKHLAGSFDAKLADGRDVAGSFDTQLVQP